MSGSEKSFCVCVVSFLVFLGFGWWRESGIYRMAFEKGYCEAVLPGHQGTSWVKCPGSK